MLDGALQGADAIRVVIGAVRERYDRQDFTFAGRWGDSGFIEDYTAEVRGRPLGCLHLVAINAGAGAAHRSPLPAAELADVLLSRAAREPRRHPVRRPLRPLQAWRKGRR